MHKGKAVTSTDYRGGRRNRLPTEEEARNQL